MGKIYYTEIALPVPLFQTYTYKVNNKPCIGARVMVSFSGRRLVGVVWRVSDAKPDGSIKIKEIIEILDDEPVLSTTLCEFASFMSGYYLHPLGEVVRAMLPASNVSRKAKYMELSGAAVVPEEVRAAFRCKPRLTYQTYKKKFPNFQDHLDAGYISVVEERRVKGRKITKCNPTKQLCEESAEPTPILTSQQEEVLNNILESGPLFSTHLLFGLTGSGKTEVYLQLIQAMFRRSGARAQALFLVPEISLTPQMTRVFSKRFPGRVAIVHSAMSQTQRWQSLAMVRRGEVSVLIGPRSAVFAAFFDLKLIIVDEEHDASYKQSTGLLYSGRDMSVVRGKLENIPVLLGSATPSAESFYNAREGKYRLHTLHERINGRPLPQVELFEGGSDRQGVKVSVGNSYESQADIHHEILVALTENFEAGQQSIVIVNRRGYSHFLFSLRERKAVVCPNCSISFTVHKKNSLLICHYCDFSTSVQSIVAAAGHNDFVAVGCGSQQAEEFLRASLPQARIERLDADAASKREVLSKILEEFGDGKIDILLGTQMLAKGHDYPNVTLTVILEIDQILGFPDFRAGEKGFQLLVQAAGRAGRSELPGKVLIQTKQPDHPVIAAGVKQDYLAFMNSQLAFRKELNYPPFSHLVAFEFSSIEGKEVRRWVSLMEKLLTKQFPEGETKGLQILGPVAPAIEVVRRRIRRQILVMGANQGPLRKTIWDWYRFGRIKDQNSRYKIDVDPISLL